MMPDHCEAQLARLGVLRGVPSDSTEYIHALADVPELVFTEAVSHALRTRTWFPTPAELRADCDVAAQGFRTASAVPLEPHVIELVGGGRQVEIPNPFGGEPLHLHITRVWTHDCDDCGDTGWRSFHCPDVACGRRHDHAAHEYVMLCECLAWNPTIRRRKEAATKYSHAAEKVA